MQIAPPDDDPSPAGPKPAFAKFGGTGQITGQPKGRASRPPKIGKAKKPDASPRRLSPYGAKPPGHHRRLCASYRRRMSGRTAAAVVAAIRAEECALLNALKRDEASQSDEHRDIRRQGVSAWSPRDHMAAHVAAPPSQKPRVATGDPRSNNYAPLAQRHDGA